MKVSMLPIAILLLTLPLLLVGPVLASPTRRVKNWRINRVSLKTQDDSCGKNKLKADVKVWYKKEAGGPMKDQTVEKVEMGGEKKTYYDADFRHLTDHYISSQDMIGNMETQLKKIGFFHRDGDNVCFEKVQVFYDTTLENGEYNDFKNVTCEYNENWETSGSGDYNPPENCWKPFDWDWMAYDSFEGFTIDDDRADKDTPAVRGRVGWLCDKASETSNLKLRVYKRLWIGKGGGGKCKQPRLFLNKFTCGLQDTRSTIRTECTSG